MWWRTYSTAAAEFLNCNGGVPLFYRRNSLIAMRFSLLIEELLIPAGVTQGLGSYSTMEKGILLVLRHPQSRRHSPSTPIEYLILIGYWAEQRSSCRAPLIERPNRLFAVSPHVCTY